MAFSVNDEFFVIDSDKLDSVKSRFYGFSNTGFAEQEPSSPDAESPSDLVDSAIPPTPKDSGGAWVRVSCTPSEIEITQDFFGCYGLYVYESGTRFVISNSFQRLAEYIAFEGLPFSLNHDYLRHYVVVDLCSTSYSETPISEIRLLPRDAVVLISRETRKMEVSYKDYGEGACAIDSAEGIAALDYWYRKWVDTVCSLVSGGERVVADLSGGLDTRIIFTILLNPRIPLDAIKITSITDEKHTHKEDFEIATMIADHFGFKLNYPADYTNTAAHAITLEESLAMSLYLKNGIHKQMYWRRWVRDEPVHHFSGSGGGGIRAFWSGDIEKFIERRLFKTYKLPSDGVKAYRDSDKAVFERSFDEIASHYDMDRSSTDLPRLLYRETRARFHFGKDLAENYMGGTIKHAPLMDEDLYKVKPQSEDCQNDDLIYAVIIDRYKPELLDFPIEGNRNFSDDILECARRINSTYPVSEETLGLKGPAAKSDGFLYESSRELMRHIESPDPDEFLRPISYSVKLKRTFKEFDPSGVYEYQVNKMSRSSYYPLKDVYPLIAVANFWELDKKRESTVVDFILGMQDSEHVDNFPRPEYPNMLRRANTAILEIDWEMPDDKCPYLVLTEGGRVKVTHERVAGIKDPNYYRIQGEDNRLRLTFDVVAGSKANILLRALKMKGSYSSISDTIFCTFNSLKICGKEQLEESVTVSGTSIWELSFEAQSDGTIVIEAEWSPSLKTNRLAAKALRLEKENERLRGELAKLRSSKARRLLRNLRPGKSDRSGSRNEQ